MPALAKNFGVTELELTGLLVNIHGFMQLLCNWYFEVLVYHKAIKFMVKSKTKTPTTRLKTLLLKLSEYTIDLKYQKDSDIPLNFLQHFTPNYIEHTYLHWVDNLYVNKTKDYDTTQVKRKCGRLPKLKTGLDINLKPAANTHTI